MQHMLMSKTGTKITHEYMGTAITQGSKSPIETIKNSIPKRMRFLSKKNKYIHGYKEKSLFILHTTHSNVYVTQRMQFVDSG